MIKSKVQQLFILGLGLMLLLRIISKIPFLPEQVVGFDTTKLLKIFTGLLFILFTFLIYRKTKKQTL